MLYGFVFRTSAIVVNDECEVPRLWPQILREARANGYVVGLDFEGDTRVMEEVERMDPDSPQDPHCHYVLTRKVRDMAGKEIKLIQVAVSKTKVN